MRRAIERIAVGLCVALIVAVHCMLGCAVALLLILGTSPSSPEPPPSIQVSIVVASLAVGIAAAWAVDRWLNLRASSAGRREDGMNVTFNTGGLLGLIFGAIVGPGICTVTTDSLGEGIGQGLVFGVIAGVLGGNYLWSRLHSKLSTPPRISS